jgi:chloramphenicol-sensitive protein RarD
VKADAQTGLFIECAYLAMPGLLYVLHLQSTGAGHFGPARASPPCC